jgi:hypothetical protein
VTRLWNEMLASAIAALEPVAAAHPDFDPDALLALLQETVTGLVALGRLEGAPAPSPEQLLASEQVIAQLVLARRRAQGLPVCLGSGSCHRTPEKVARGLATLYLCERHRK